MENSDLESIGVIKQQARDFFVLSALGVILVKIRGFVFVKIFSTFLGTSDYGYFFFIQNNGLILATIIAFNIQTAIYRLTSESSAEKDENKTLMILMSGIILSLLIAVLTNVSMYLLAFTNITLFTSDTYLLDLVAIGAFGTLIGLDTIILEFYRSHQKKKMFFSLQTIIPFLTLLGSILFGIVANLSVFGLILANILGYLILIIPILIKLFLQTDFSKFNLLYFKNILNYSLPGLPVIFLGSIKIFFLNLLLKAYYGNDALGTYSVALSIANLFAMFDYIVSLSYPTIIMKNFDVGNHAYVQHFANKMSRIYLTLMIALTFMLSAFSPILVLIFSSPDFLDSAILIPIILFAFVFQALIRLTCFGVLLQKKTKEGGIFNSISHFLHLAFIILIIPSLSSMGAAICLLLFYIVTFALNFYLSQSVYPVSYEKSRFIRIAISLMFSLAIGVLFFFLNNNLFYTSFLFSFCIFVVLAIGFRLVNIQEIRSIFLMLKPSL